MLSRTTKGSGLLGHHVWARPAAAQVHVTPTPCRFVLAMWQNAAPGTVRWAARGYLMHQTQFHLKSRSHVQNLNQISSQSSGIDATLHLTLKWEQVVLVDYRWLITGWQRWEISLEIRLYPILLIAIYLPVYPSIFLSLYPSLPLFLSIWIRARWAEWNKIIHILIRNIISNETSKPLCTLATWHSFC